jgi:hypothetical protein
MEKGRTLVMEPDHRASRCRPRPSTCGGCSRSEQSAGRAILEMEPEPGAGLSCAASFHCPRTFGYSTQVRSLSRARPPSRCSLTTTPLFRTDEVRTLLPAAKRSKTVPVVAARGRKPLDSRDRPVDGALPGR